MRKKFLKRMLSILMVATLTLEFLPFGRFLNLTASAVTYKVGDVFEFGSYPQSRVTDPATLSALSYLNLTWESYEYYSGDGKYGSMKQSDYMKYADIEYNGNQYRAVKFTKYRPNYTIRPAGDAFFSLQDDNGYLPDTVYWFKYEPLKWRILDTTIGYIMCEYVIDSQAFSNTIYENGEDQNGYTEYWNDADFTKHANDYETSSIRAWLNNDFYNVAFSEEEQTEISYTTIDNSLSDKIFMPSQNDMKNSNYGFSVDEDGLNRACNAKGTDYAQCQGLGIITYEDSDSAADWLLRSPGYCSLYSCYIYRIGVINDTCDVDSTSSGVRPALRVSDIASVIAKSCKHENMTEERVEPTCTTDGSLSRTCTYCDYTETETIAKLGHDMGDWNTTLEPDCINNGSKLRKCLNCDYTETEVIEKNGHEADEWEIVTQPTCTSSGVKKIFCAKCDTELDVAYIDTVSHNYFTTIINPTCVEKGYSTHTCANCSYKYIDNYVSPLGHTVGEWKIITEATYDYDGEKALYCLVYDEVIKTEAIKKLPSKVTGIALNQSTYEINYKDSFDLTADIEFEGKADYTVKYSSSDTNVATVDGNGNVTGKMKGNAVITCTVLDEYGNTFTDTCDVTVNFTFVHWLLYIICFGWIWM